MSSDFAATSPYGFNTRSADRTARPAPRPGPDAAAAETPMFPTTPIYATRRKSTPLLSSTSLIAGGAVLAVFAAAVFAIARPSTPEPVEVAATPMTAPSPLEPTVPAALDTTHFEAPAAVETAAAEPVSAPAAEPRRAAPRASVRAAAPPPPAATDTAEDAAAMLPAGPMPYTPSTADETTGGPVMDVTPTPIAPPAPSAAPGAGEGVEPMVPATETMVAP